MIRRPGWIQKETDPGLMEASDMPKYLSALQYSKNNEKGFLPSQCPCIF